MSHFTGCKTAIGGRAIVIFECDPIHWGQNPDGFIDNAIELRAPLGMVHCTYGGLKRDPPVGEFIMTCGQVGLISWNACIGLGPFLFVTALNRTAVVVPASLAGVDREVAAGDTPATIRRKSVVAR
jgi:hypothetical protein